MVNGDHIYSDGWHWVCHRKGLWIILVVATLFRLPFLASNPVGVHADEASTGYDAYSIWKTGKDQHGISFPLFARSFGDYNEALHRYMVAPFVGVLGLNAFSVRLPNALLGILTVWMVYHLALVLWGRVSLACFAGVLLAISPWHVQFSRWGARAILLPLFFCLALWLFLKGKEHIRYWLLSALAFGLCLYTYSSARVFIPIFLVGLIWIYWDEVMHHKRVVLISGCVFVLILAGLFRFWITPEGMNRAQELVNFDLIEFFFSYVSYFGPGFLFFEGDSNLRHSVVGMGQLYHFELVLVPLGLWYLWREKKKKTSHLIFLWFILYSIPAAFTGEPHAIRAIVGAPLFALLSGLGFYTLWQWVKLQKHYRVLIAGMGLVGAINVFVYLKIFYVDYPKDSAWWWEYGMSEVVAYAEEQPYLCVLHNHGFHTPFYIHILFHAQYPPEKYQQLPKVLREQFWAFMNKAFQDKYLNADVRLLEFDADDVALLVMRPEDIGVLDDVEYDWREVHAIYDPAGKKMISIVEAKNAIE